MNNRLININNSSEEDRFDYFIRQVVQFKQVWAISVDESYVMFGLKDGKTVFPVWSDHELALEFMFKEHKDLGAVPDKISLLDFTKECIPDMVSEEVYFGINYNLERKAIITAGDLLLVEIQDEYEEIWEEKL